MVILYKQKCIDEINNVVDLEIFLKSNNFFKLFKKIPTQYIDDVEKSISNTEKLNYKKVKPWLKSILNYPESMYNPKFLHCMGWEEHEIRRFISNKQKLNASVLSSNKKNNPKLYFSSTTSRVEYWLTKGYDLDESKLKVSERQKTFSKKLCIEKFGEEKGVKVFEERQKKWINSLKSRIDYNDIQKLKNSYDYQSLDYEKFIGRTSFLEKNKQIILKYFSNENVYDFVDNVLKDIDIKRYSDIHPYISSSIIQKKFSISKNELKNIFYSKTFYNLKKQTYGIPVFHNNIRFKSIKEYRLAIYLESNKINYIYENNYPNSNKKFDFYLPDFDLYIEYFGLLDGKNEDKLDEIQKKYREKMYDKILFCEKNELNLIYDTNFDELIIKIKKYI